MYYSCRWALRRGLEEERNETLSGWRKSSAITVYFSSKKCSLGILCKLRFGKCSYSYQASTSNLKLAFANADLNPNYKNLGTSFFADFIHLLNFLVNLRNIKISFLPSSKLLINIMLFKPRQTCKMGYFCKNI